MRDLERGSLQIFKKKKWERKDSRRERATKREGALQIFKKKRWEKKIQGQRETHRDPKSQRYGKGGDHKIFLDLKDKERENLENSNKKERKREERESIG